MASGDTNSAFDVKTEETVFKFANNALSDVIFDVGGKEFHCHKMFLAVKSDYFASMFASGFKEKDLERITIEADPAAFKRLMEIIYNGYIEDAEELFLCISFDKLNITITEFSQLLWKALTDLFALADRFLLTDVVRFPIELLLLRYDRDCPWGGRCPHCTTKLLLALCHNIDKYKTIKSWSQSTVKTTLSCLPEDIQLSGAAVTFLLGLKS